MNYIHGKNILLHSIISVGIVFSLTIGSNVYCAPGKDDNHMDQIGKINKSLDDLEESVDSVQEEWEQYNQTRQRDSMEMDISLKNILSDIEALDDCQNSAADPSEFQVDEVGRDIKDPENAISETVKLSDKYSIVQDHAISGCSLTDVQLKQQAMNETQKLDEHPNDIKEQVANGEGTPPQSTVSVHNTPTPIYDVPKPSYSARVNKVSKPVYSSDGMLHEDTTSRHNTSTHILKSLPYPIKKPQEVEQHTYENTVKNNNNLHSTQVNTRKKRSVPYDSEDNDMDSYELNKDDILYSTLKHAPQVYKAYDDDSGNHEYAEIPDAVDDPSNSKYDLYQDDDHMYDDIIEAETHLYNSEDEVDVPAKLNDSSKYDLYQDDDHMYDDIIEAETRLYNSEDEVDVPAKLNDSNDEHNSNQDDEHIYAEMGPRSGKGTVDVPAKLNDSNDEHNSNQDDNAKNETDPDTPDGNPPTPDTDDDAPDNYIIADANNQLSNTYNQKKAIAHGDHGIFSHLFNSANYTALHRISSRLTAYALDHTIDGQFTSQRLVSSGSNISNAQHEIWIMPLIKKGEKYVNNASKYTISTYGINVGFDSKIPHYKRNMESVLGIVFALYNSQLQNTASDSATLLNTYIISMYYSIIFNQKFFIYTLFSFGTSNAGNYHSTIGVNNNRIYNPEPCSSYNAFRQSVELHTGYNIMVYDSQLHDRQIVLLPMAGVQIDTVALHGDTKQHYSSVQQLKLSTGIKIVHHQKIKPSISINSSLYGFVNYCAWSNTITHIDQSLISNFENSTLVEKENLATSNNKLYYRIGGEASLQYNRVMYSLRYEMNLAQDYLSHQIGLKIKLKF